ncbi:MAG: hypothetical protein AAFQ83_20990 [Bacteroidota bacterium]
MRKIRLNEELTYNHQIWGLATESRIWTLSHAINQHLGLQLIREDSTLHVDSEMEKASKKSKVRPIPEFLYKDSTTYQDQHIFLISAQKQFLPVEVRPFRYFLILRYISPTTPLPNLNEQLLLLKAEKHVQAVVDLTHLSELKHIIP